MTISPSSMKPTNMKNREVYCPKCKKYTMSDEQAPTCVECFGTTLITVIYRLDGTRITGNDELASTTS